MVALICGGAGFIGLNIAEAHLRAGDSVVLLDRGTVPPVAAAAFDALPGQWVHAQVDITDGDAVAGVFAAHAIDRVFYGAAVTSGADRERDRPDQVISVNLLGLANVIKAAAKSGVRRLINTSSGSSYGDGGLAAHGATAPLDELDTRPLPSTLYGVTKLASEGMCRRLSALNGMDIRSVRLAIIFGAWERDTGFRDTLSSPMQAAALAVAGGTATVNRVDVRDWTYSRDVARALMALMAAPALSGDLYNVTAGRTCSTLDWCARLAKGFPGFSYRLAEPGEAPTVNLHGDSDRLVMSPRRLSADTGHVVPGDIDATAEDFIAWIKAHPGYWRA